MVVVLHLNGYGLNNAEYESFGAIGITSALGQSFCFVGVNIFVLISGYFLSRKDTELSKKNLFNQYKRLVPLWIQVEMYSIGIYLVLCTIPQSGVEFGYRQLIKQALPLMTNQYWFFTIYVLLILVSPFINHLTCRLERQAYRNMLIVLIVVFSLVPSLNIFGDSFGTAYGFSLLWFVVLYLVGGYIRLFDIKYRRYRLWYFGFTLFIFICHLLLNVAPKAIQGFLNIFSSTYTSIFVFAASVSLFLAFLKSTLKFKKTGKIIALVSSSSFAVYLIHEHGLFRDIFWERLVCLSNYSHYPGVCLLIMLISITGIYVFSIFVELVRVKICNLAIDIKKVLNKDNR